MIKMTLPKDVLTKNPTIDASAFIARGAQVMGDVRVAAHVSIWYNCVCRGDINYISIGENTNVQDGSILHLENDFPCIIENDVTIGHHANIHGCHIEEGCLIGIGAIILSGAHIKRGSIIGAGAVVKENAVIEPFSLVVGIPGKVIRKTPEDTVETQIKWAQKYVQLAQIHKEKGLGISPLTV